MAKAQRTDQKARDDLVTNAQHCDAFKHPVAQANRGCHGNDIATEQRQLHRILPLRHPIAHRGHGACDLRRGANFAREYFHLLGVAAIWLMRRQHVVIGTDNADVHRFAAANGRLILTARGKAMRQIAAA